MEERRKGQHTAVHRLSQVYADLLAVEKEIKELPESDRRFRAIAYVRNSYMVIGHVIDDDLGPKLIEEVKHVI